MVIDSPNKLLELAVLQKHTWKPQIHSYALKPAPAARADCAIYSE